MEMKLAQNIRALRKERRLTQEQLAEVLRVSVGAVYKWEAGLSQPDLETIMELADFFDTSVDALLGYEMKDNRLQATVERLKRCRDEKDRSGFAEAEKALKKYPNSFEVVYYSAVLYNVFGLESREKPLLHRALELLESSRLQLAQNADPKISEATIYGSMASVLLGLNEAEQAVALLQKHNAGGMYDALIGLTLAADCKRPDEALPFLSESLLNHTVSLIQTAMGYFNVFFDKKDYRSAKDILHWEIAMLSGLKDHDTASFFDKMNSVLLVCLAEAELCSGDAAAARRALLRAGELARQFDAAPGYHLRTVRFTAPAERASAYDDIGATAEEGIRNILRAFDDAALNALWKDLNDHE